MPLAILFEKCAYLKEILLIFLYNKQYFLYNKSAYNNIIRRIVEKVDVIFVKVLICTMNNLSTF